MTRLDMKVRLVKLSEGWGTALYSRSWLSVPLRCRFRVVANNSLRSIILAGKWVPKVNVVVEIAATGASSA